MGTFALAIYATLAASAIWLMVRIVNRRERWAKRTAVAMLLVAAIGYFGAYFTMVDLPLSYALSGRGPWQLRPRYWIGTVELDQKDLERFFSPAHWIDRRIRRTKWTIELLTEITEANFGEIRLGMTIEELRRLLGPPEFYFTELGIVKGELYFDQSEAGKAGPKAALQKYVRQQ